MTETDFKLIETMRLDEDGGYFLLERHLHRLASSSRVLGFACPLAVIEKRLGEKAASLEPGTWRVRLVLARDGSFEIGATVIDRPDPDQTISFVFSSRRVGSHDELLRHKTTRRQLFDDEWQRANHLYGAGEVLFGNERGELSEGARSNLFIRPPGGGPLLTPPLSCGLLPGPLRASLLEEGKAVEHILDPHDLDGAKIYFGNSVRGLQAATLCRIA